MQTGTNRPQSSITAKLPGRPMTATSGGPSRPITAQPVKFGGVDEDEAARRKLLLVEDIQKKKNKEKFEDRLISIAVNKIQNEKAYEYLIKMGAFLLHRYPSHQITSHQSCHLERWHPFRGLVSSTAIIMSVPCLLLLPVLPVQQWEYKGSNKYYQLDCGL